MKQKLIQLKQETDISTITLGISTAPTQKLKELSDYQQGYKGTQ